MSRKFSTEPDPGSPMPADPLAEAWSRARRRLQTQLGEDVFVSWFGRLELDSVDEDGTAHLTVPTRFLKNWIQSHYADRILAVLVAEAPQVKRLKIDERPTFRSQPPKAAAGGETVRHVHSVFPTMPAAGPATPFGIRSALPHGAMTSHEEPSLSIDGITRSPLDRRLSFASFLVGRSNQLAHAAAERIALVAADGGPAYNPLYIHASVRLGKTHLLQAISHAAPGPKRRAIYLTAE